MTIMKEHPILFSGPMVRAILDGSKTQTRRVMQTSNWKVGLKDQFTFGPSLSEEALRKCKPRCRNRYYFIGAPPDIEINLRFPYGLIGDRLWVRETHWRYGQWVKNGKTRAGKQKWKFQAMSKEVRFEPQPKTSDRTVCGWFRRPSIFLPKGTARITLEITDVRVQRVQEIGEEDAMAEGVDWEDHAGLARFTAKKLFHELWDSINSKRPGCAWSDNPWVWAITFRRVE
jgi:hypothetical protein